MKRKTTMHDEFHVDYVNSDSRAMTEAALDEAEARERFLRGAANDDEEDVRDEAA